MNPQPDIEEITLPTQTYRVQNGRIISFTDGKDAMRQAIEKILTTARFSVPWLSSSYGHDLDDLIGKSQEYASAEIERMIKEALSADDRVTSVEVTTPVELDKTTLFVKVSVVTLYGTVESTTEVTTNDA
ncbi:DUF2634 domain-containing protein [Weissella cibaria]|uniref:DUF2634 domain-containing protein n=1 Tax=Weissella cibaria TaxID=137591 RepID=UPI0022E901C6|nr:DUF2634 domain-containing protein [Weissella cibaria]